MYTLGAPAMAFRQVGQDCCCGSQDAKHSPQNMWPLRNRTGSTAHMDWVGFSAVLSQAHALV